MTERISLAKETKQILQENGIILNKNLGQNYLIDDFKRKKIIEYAKLTKEDTVLEIGPGIGTLTIELAKKAGKVIAIEQDTAIFNILKKRLEKEKIDNVELINGDAVKVDFPEFNKGRGRGRNNRNKGRKPNNRGKKPQNKPNSENKE